MCLHCGCGEKSNRHGNQDSITIGDLHKAMDGSAHSQGPRATARELQRMTVRHARKRK